SGCEQGQQSSPRTGAGSGVPPGLERGTAWPTAGATGHVVMLATTAAAAAVRGQRQPRRSGAAGSVTAGRPRSPDRCDTRVAGPRSHRPADAGAAQQALAACGATA